VNISDDDVVLSTFCSSCFLYLFLIMRLLVIPLLICGFGFIVVPFAVLLVLFVVTTHTRAHTFVLRELSVGLCRRNATIERAVAGCFVRVSRGC
jgi:hypothetical protein